MAQIENQTEPGKYQMNQVSQGHRRPIGVLGARGDIGAPSVYPARKDNSAPTSAWMIFQKAILDGRQWCRHQ